MSDLTEKVALITGAGSGIGAATAIKLASLGAKLVLAGRRKETLSEVVEQIKALGGEAVAVTANMNDEPQIAAMVEQAVKAFGRIDILHNNAALTDAATMAEDGAVTEMDIEVWDKIMAVNLRGPMLCCKHVIPHMLKQGGGSIIMAGSGKASAGDLGQPAYGASKAALVNLTQNIATQYGKQGIRANIVIIGLVLSEQLKASFSPPIRKMIESHHLTPELGSPEQIANTVAFLASEDSSFVTGQALYADGGFTAHAPSVADTRRMFESQ